ncbi:MAG: PilZ domain-containing protein [Candidatus Omnitrophota bacterium]
MSYKGPERRKSPRIGIHFIVSYRVYEEENNIDISQAKNLGLGGMLLTTNRLFPPGTKLALEIRLPFDPHPLTIIGEVLESNEVIKDLIYDTRLQFLAVDSKHKNIMGKTVDYFLKKGES